MTSDLRQSLSRYVDGGWVDVARDDSPRGLLVPAYLVLASSGMIVPPRSEVQVTSRCYRPFRAHKMIVAEASARFDLLDLKIGNRSQFQREASIPLRDHAGWIMGRREEVQPYSIKWPLEVCPFGAEVVARAIISDGNKEDLGAEFEIVLLGEALS